MAKTATKIAWYALKLNKLIAKGYITEADIIDSSVKAEYDKVKALK